MSTWMPWQIAKIHRFSAANRRMTDWLIRKVS